MPTDTAAPPHAPDIAAQPWEGICAALTAGLAERAGRHPGTPPVLVVPLGTRDELVRAPREFPPDTLVIGLYGQHAVIGPKATDGLAGCTQCLVRRWQGVRAGFLRDALERGGDTVATGTPPWRTAFAVDALAELVAAVAGQRRPAPHPWVWLLDLETLHVSRFPLVPDGECPSCGTRPDDTAEAARITLLPTPEHSPGAFRSRPLDSYDIALPAFANPVTGMLGPSVAPDLTSITTSSTVGSFTSRSGHYLRETYWGGHADAYQASVRIGLLEGLERYAGMRARARRTVVTAALDELGDTAVDPRVAGLYSDALHTAEPEVPRFAPDCPVAWVWGWSLRDARPVLVPEVLAYYHAPGGLQRRFVQDSSNGCASGGSLAEAVLHGLMETIERDAFLLAWFGRARLPEIDPSSSASPATRAMVDRLAMYGYRARFFDTRITFEVPVVTAVAQRIDGGMGLLCFGAGASPSPEAALAGGLREIATDAVNLRGRATRDERRLRRMAQDFTEVRVLHDHPFLYGLPEMGRYADFLLGERDDADLVPLRTLAGPRPSGDLSRDVEACVRAISAHGFDVVVVDQSSPEQRAVGLFAAKVLVPGLIPIDFGWRRQRGPLLPRMRTALREAGLRADDLTPDQLNPAPHPFP